MIEQEFVKYEEALALKKLGLDEDCFGYYHVNSGYTKGYAFCYFNKPETETCDSDISIPAPTYAQAFRFFRYCYWYYVSISPSVDLNNVDFTIEVSQFFQEDRYVGEGGDEEYFPRGLQLVHTERLDSYPEAELACLKKLIEIAKAQKS
jgi:hypothetical protein